MSADRRRESIDDLDALLAALPREIVDAVHALPEKEALIDMDPAAFFTEPHYNGYPAVLVRLDAVDLGMLQKLLHDAWRIQAPKRLVRETEAGAD